MPKKKTKRTKESPLSLKAGRFYTGSGYKNLFNITFFDDRLSFQQRAYIAQKVLIVFKREWKKLFPDDLI